MISRMTTDDPVTCQAGVGSIGGWAAAPFLDSVN
jgi:hypothetical protein